MGAMEHQQVVAMGRRTAAMDGVPLQPQLCHLVCELCTCHAQALAVASTVGCSALACRQAWCLHAGHGSCSSSQALTVVAGLHHVQSSPVQSSLPSPAAEAQAQVLLQGCWRRRPCDARRLGSSHRAHILPEPLPGVLLLKMMATEAFTALPSKPVWHECNVRPNLCSAPHHRQVGVHP